MPLELVLYPLNCIKILITSIWQSLLHKCFVEKAVGHILNIDIAHLVLNIDIDITKVKQNYTLEYSDFQKYDFHSSNYDIIILELKKLI